MAQASRPINYVVFVRDPFWSYKAFFYDRDTAERLRARYQEQELETHIFVSRGDDDPTLHKIAKGSWI